MSGHYKLVCACGTVISQCRCADPNKTIIKGTCATCARATEAQQHGS